MPTTLQPAQDTAAISAVDTQVPTVEKTAPKETGFRLWFSRFMFIPGVGGNFVPLIQAAEIVRLGSSGSVSLAGFSFALFCIVCWLIYGLLRSDKVLIWANVIGVINLVALIACIIVYA